MELLDYTGKLNDNESYLKILDKIEKKCEFIEIVILDGKKSNKLVDKFSDEIIDTSKVSLWWGTKTNGSNYLYRINSSKELFEYLRTFETFCKYYEYGTTEESLRRGDYSVDTDFGIDDIAFYDKAGDCLLCTTTHEGYIFVSDSLIGDFK